MTCRAAFYTKGADLLDGYTRVCEFPGYGRAVGGGAAPFPICLLCLWKKNRG